MRGRFNLIAAAFLPLIIIFFLGIGIYEVFFTDNPMNYKRNDFDTTPTGEAWKNCIAIESPFRKDGAVDATWMSGCMTGYYASRGVYLRNKK